MNAYASSALSIFLFMNIIFLFALKMRRNDLADVVWGPGFLVSSFGAWLSQILADKTDSTSMRLFLTFLVLSIWALRLFWHLGYRNLNKKNEDIRYARMRSTWGNNWKLKSYFIVFMLQGFLMWIISLPVTYLIQSPARQIDLVFILGISTWIFGFVFESISDSQLEKFKANPENKGHIMDRGLWSWSRHPNYFGEVVQWWGIYLMAFDNLGGWFLILSPVTITFLILKVSGVPMLEELMKNKPGFSEYQKKTSVFFPRPPKK